MRGIRGKLVNLLIAEGDPYVQNMVMALMDTLALKPNKGVVKKDFSQIFAKLAEQED